MTDRIPSWIPVIGAVIFAIPFGGGLGVLAAYLIAGSNFGQLPLMTVPLCIAVAVAFAAVPRFKAWTRFAVMAGATALFMLAAYMAP